MAPVTSLNQARRLVIKIGSALLVDQPTGQLRFDWLRSLASDISNLKRQGKDVLLVSSGSIALGRRILELPDGALSLEQSQAAAAVGQIRLARAYEEALRPHDITTAQVLLTLEDSAHRRRYLNSRTTFNALLSHGVVPIVNENDTVATDEIRYGDNDRLGAQVAAMAGADLLILLSDVDGFYSGDPRKDPAAKWFPRIEKVTSEVEAMAGGAGTSLSSGGMKTKIMAAKTATLAGCAMVITKGEVDNPVEALAQGARCTWFEAAVDPQAARKNWIAGMKSKGTLTIDDGAARALASGKSLLPAGVTMVSGQFERGDPVTIATKDGQELASGLSAYEAGEARVIAGCHSAEIKTLLGYPGRPALVHRDDMVM